MTVHRLIHDYVFEGAGMPMTRRTHPTIAYINMLGSTWGAHRATCTLVKRGTPGDPDDRRVEQAVCKVCGWTGTPGTGATVYRDLIAHAEETLLAVQLANRPAASVPADSRDPEERVPEVADGTGETTVLVVQPEPEGWVEDRHPTQDNEGNLQAAEEIVALLRDIQQRLERLERGIRPRRRRVRKSNRTRLRRTT